MIKERNIVLAILFSFLTCGIYMIYWFICLSDDTNTVANENGTSGGMAFLFSLITCGIYTFYWMYKQGEKLDAAKTARGIANNGNSGIIYLVLTLFGFGIIAYALMQDSLNKLA